MLNRNYQPQKKKEIKYCLCNSMQYSAVHHGLAVWICVRKLVKTISVFGLLIFLTSTVQAQKPGKLTGKITDAANNESLSGVSITSKNSKSGVTSITDGTYIYSLAPGTYTIRYSTSGYKTKEITEIIIKADETTFLNIAMEVATKDLGEVVIKATARKESQSSVYAIQKTSAAASDGISIEAINRTPDNNSGQVLRRVTGVNVQDNKFVVVRGLNEQYNQTMLNGVPMTSTEGNKNAFAFDLIPAAAIDNIVVNKTATPDMPGNFAGGIVQINTKDFPAKSFLSFSVQLGFSSQTYGKDFYGDERAPLQFMGFDGGIRNLPKDFPTNSSRVPIFAMNYSEQVRFLSMLPNNLVPINHGPSGFNEQVQIGWGKNFNFPNKTQLGIVVSLNQRKTQLIEQDINLRNPDPVLFGPEHLIFPDRKKELVEGSLIPFRTYSENMRYKYNVDFGGVLNIAYRFGTNKITLKNLFTQVYSNQFVDRPYVLRIGNSGIESITPPANYQQIGFNYINSTKRIFNSVLAGEHRTGANNETRINWNLSSTLNNTNQPDTRSFILGADSTKLLVGTNTNVRTFAEIVGQASRIWNNLSDVVWSSGLNISTPFYIAKQKQIFKTGFLIQNRSRKNRATILPVTEIRPGTLLDSAFSPFAYANGSTTLSLIAAGAISRGGDYNAGSSLLAVYESIENKIGEQWRFIWGLRLEKYQQIANAYSPAYYAGFRQFTVSPASISARTEFNLLPSVNIIYSPVSSVNIRAAYSNTAIRPDLRDIIDIPYFDIVNLRATQGNPELKSTAIRNFDLKAEWFPKAGEIFSASVFYKTLTNPIEYVTPTNTVAYAEITGMPVNTGSAFVQGVEVEWRKKLDFIKSLSWLKNVTLFGNATLLRSKVKEQVLQSNIISKVLEHRLTGQPNSIFNTGISISALKNTLEFTASFNRSGDNIGELGFMTIRGVPRPDGSVFQRRETPDFYVRARNLVDMVISKSFLKNKARIKLNITNLLEEPFILYQDMNMNGRFDEPILVNKGPNEQLPSQAIRPEKEKAGRYISGFDNTATRLTGQRLYEFTFSYTF
jgi:Outer membrane protein beta-barrel family/CarboxypepD_reg-like domain/TonB-dependent Receptor Plug Domain